MELSLSARDQLRVTLTAQELERFSLTYASLDYRNVETKRAVWQILAEAKERFAFDADGSRLYIRAYPLEGGGCELNISLLEGGKETEQEPPPPVTVRAVRFASLQDLTAACRALPMLGRLDTGLYTDAEDRLLLLLRLQDSREAEGMLFSLCEFGEEAMPDSAGRPLCEKNAAEILAAL